MDGHLQLSPQKSRDAVSFLQLQERGIQFADVALDGARGGVKQAGLTVPLRPDLFRESINMQTGIIRI